MDAFLQCRHLSLHIHAYLSVTGQDECSCISGRRAEGYTTEEALEFCCFQAMTSCYLQWTARRRFNISVLFKILIYVSF
jgi:hypothetical protein